MDGNNERTRTGVSDRTGTDILYRSEVVYTVSSKIVCFVAFVA